MRSSYFCRQRAHSFYYVQVAVHGLSGSAALKLSYSVDQFRGGGSSEQHSHSASRGGRERCLQFGTADVEAFTPSIGRTSGRPIEHLPEVEAMLDDSLWDRR